MSYSCLDCGQIFETLDELQNHDCVVAEMEIGHEVIERAKAVKQYLLVGIA